MTKKIVLACTVCGSRNYSVPGSKQTAGDRLELNKFCKNCNAHMLHKETK